MMKKAIALAGAGAVLLSMAVPAFAKRHHHQPQPQPTWDVNVAMVYNSAYADADTGRNDQMGMAYSSGGDATVDQYMDTGDASADATAVVVANTEVRCGSGEDSCGCRENDVDLALVYNEAGADADTGRNDQMGMAYASGGGNNKPGGCKHGKCGGSNSGDALVYHTMYTGDASVDSEAWTVVNTELRR